MTDQSPHEGELILYRPADDAVHAEVLSESESFWLDKRRMAELYGIDKRLAEEQYDKFRVHQDHREFESDFEAEVKLIQSKRPRKRKDEP